MDSFGFTLFELLIVLCILGILCAIAYPNYTLYLIKARRGDGKLALVDLASRLEHYYVENQSYPFSISRVLNSSQSREGWYSLNYAELSEETYTITATPLKSQVNDSSCKTLTLDHLGVRGSTGTDPPERCW